MKKNLQLCATAFLIELIITGCNTYYVASSDRPLDLYTNYNVSQIGYSVPTGTILLIRNHVKNGLTQVRVHSNRTWYWVSAAYITFVPDFDPRYYALTYSDYESGTRSASNAGSGYDATIQTGSRGGKYYINKNGNKTYVPRSTVSGSTRVVGGRGSKGGKY